MPREVMNMATRSGSARLSLSPSSLTASSQLTRVKPGSPRRLRKG